MPFCSAKVEIVEEKEEREAFPEVYAVFLNTPCCKCAYVDSGPTEEVRLAGAIPIDGNCEFYKPRKDTRESA